MVFPDLQPVRHVMLKQILHQKMTDEREQNVHSCCNKAIALMTFMVTALH